MSTAAVRASVRDSIPETSVWDLFLDRLSNASSRVLLLDYDGTIAPFTVSRNRAFPYPTVPELLDGIMTTCHTRVVLISGRAAREISPLLGLNPHPEIWGTNGLECLRPDGHYELAEMSQKALRVLAGANAWLKEQGLGDAIELKPGAVAVHWRGLNAGEKEEVRTKAYRVFAPLIAQADLLLTEFNGGLELRVRTPNKGDVVRAILAELEPSVPVAYLGDDVTDEEAFRALAGRGLTALVRPTYRFTAAQTWLRPPEQLIQFLTEWMRACGGDI